MPNFLIYSCKSLIGLLPAIVVLTACGPFVSNSCADTNLQAVTQINSPEGAIKLEVSVGEQEGLKSLYYQVFFHGQPVIAPSRTRFVLPENRILGDQIESVKADDARLHRETWKPVYGERAKVENNYRSVSVHCRDREAGLPLTIEFRCYDAGVALRATLGNNETDRVHVLKEHVEFNFFADPLVWKTTNAQGLYEKVKLSEMGRDVERPLTIQVDENTFVAIAEANLVDYARTNLRASSTHPHGAVTQIGSPVKAEGPLTTPWRVVSLAKSAGELLEQNDILMNLSDPCRIEDTDWIRPGKVLREITLTTAGGMASIDFASRHNFQFVEFDAGWYGHEYDDISDATTVSLDPKRSSGPFDLSKLIRYADSHNIGVILYVNRRALETQLDEILPLYKSWGVAGVKYGFVRVGSQEWTSWLHEAIRKAAEHRLMVDVHDEYRPTGYSRTYPNFMTQEGVRGDEASPSTEQALTSLFTRSLAGAADFTPCYFAERVDEHWSHAHQLAKTVCFYSPWQFIFWYDTPLSDHASKNSIIETPELEFIDRVPTTWDDTSVIHGKIGKYAVIARQKGDEWFVGAMNNSESRTLDLPLDFLRPEVTYLAHIYADDESVDTPTRVGISKKQVKSITTLQLQLQSNGGQAIRIVPLKRNEEPSNTATSKPALNRK